MNKWKVAALVQVVVLVGILGAGGWFMSDKVALPLEDGGMVIMPNETYGLCAMLGGCVLAPAIFVRRLGS